MDVRIYKVLITFHLPILGIGVEFDFGVLGERLIFFYRGPLIES